MTTEALRSVVQHSKFWLDDGNLVMHVHNAAFKVHRSLLHRHSRALPSLTCPQLGDEDENVIIAVIPPSMGVRVGDLEVLLEHLYHDEPLQAGTPFARVASIIRVTSAAQLDFPGLHLLACSYLEAMFPSGPQPFTHPDCLEDALVLAAQHDIHSIRKGLLYSLVTTTHFDTEEADPSAETKPSEDSISDLSQGEAATRPGMQSKLSPADAKQCRDLMTAMMQHFTPVLFTVPTTAGHMECSDVFADKWMTLVLQHALENDGVYKPLETLQRIIELDWEEAGLCKNCIREKREEWRDEQEDIWRRIDSWITPADNAVQTL